MDLMCERSLLEPRSDDFREVILYEIPGEGEDAGVREFGKGEEFFCDDLDEISVLRHRTLHDCAPCSVSHSVFESETS